MKHHDNDITSRGRNTKRRGSADVKCHSSADIRRSGSADRKKSGTHINDLSDDTSDRNECRKSPQTKMVCCTFVSRSFVIFFKNLKIFKMLRHVSWRFVLPVLFCSLSCECVLFLYKGQRSKKSYHISNY